MVRREGLSGPRPGEGKNRPAAPCPPAAGSARPAPAAGEEGAKEGAVRIGPLRPEDCAPLAAGCADAADPWSAADLAAELGKETSRCFAAYLGERAAGFACFSLLEETAELEMVAVASPLRGRGIAGALLAAALCRLAAAGARRCLLEVRCSNAPALALYRRLGFAPLARRPALFDRPREDGFTMELALPPAMGE